MNKVVKILKEKEPLSPMTLKNICLSVGIKEKEYFKQLHSAIAQEYILLTKDMKFSTSEGTGQFY